MIAAIIEKEGQDPHVVFWTGRSGLHVAVKTFCGRSLNANSSGVYQLPDGVKVCNGCEAGIETVKKKMTR